MVAIPGYAAFAFHNGLDQIRDAFRLSIGSMETAGREAEASRRRYVASGEDDSERDEDGALVSSTRHELGWAEMQAWSAASVIREAFVTSAFHFWELSARAWTGENKSNGFDRLRARVLERYPVDPDLVHLNSLNNLLKHGNPQRGREVFEWRRELFLFGRMPSGNGWRGSLAIRTADVEQFLEIVRRSGPPSDTPMFNQANE